MVVDDDEQPAADELTQSVGHPADEAAEITTEVAAPFGKRIGRRHRREVIGRPRAERRDRIGGHADEP
jgi:hypothetical protein